MDALHLGEDGLWSDAVADLPASGVESLAERADDARAAAQIGVAEQAFVATAVEDDVLVDLVADQQEVAAVDDLRQLPHVLDGPRDPRRIVRRVNQDGARSRGDRASNLVPVDAVVR